MSSEKKKQKNPAYERRSHMKRRPFLIFPSHFLYPFRVLPPPFSRPPPSSPLYFPQSDTCSGGARTHAPFTHPRPRKDTQGIFPFFCPAGNRGEEILKDASFLMTHVAISVVFFFFLTTVGEIFSSSAIVLLVLFPPSPPPPPPDAFLRSGGGEREGFTKSQRVWLGSKKGFFLYTTPFSPTPKQTKKESWNSNSKTKPMGFFLCFQFGKARRMCHGISAIIGSPRRSGG